MNTFDKIGVLLVNLGTPDGPDTSSVRRYLKQFLLDPRVVDIPAVPRNLLVRGIIAPFRAPKSAKAYQDLWTEGGSPLKTYGYSLLEQVREQLGDDYVVELGMRYQQPSMESALEKLLETPLRKLIVFPLFPQYASATTGSVHEEVMRLLMKKQTIPPLHLVRDYYDHPAFINAFLERAKEHDWREYDHVLFSYHGLPKRQLRKADPTGEHCQKKENCCATICEANYACYGAQCFGTTKALVEALGIPEDKYTTCFQSRLGKDPWVEPYTSDVLEECSKKGDKRILVFCPAFVADCLETTVEISDEYAEEFEEMGGEHLQLVESLNDHPTWVKGVVQLVKEA